ncbi:Mitochondrial-processing peptidase subunit alpha [Serendipita sp. 399]|nr:Mitochondrial-processing peptidase subunit alpha [Serendipita sp. 399]
MLRNIQLARARYISSSIPRAKQLPKRCYASRVEPLPTKITTLGNKLRVATEATPGHFSAVGVYIDAGSRYEAPQFTGVSHILDRMAFKSTQNRSSSVMSTEIDPLGGQMFASSSRETIMYQSSHFHNGTPLAMSILADTILNPLFLAEELQTQREAARYEVRELNSKPETMLPEALHYVAYQGNTLGNPALCPDERIDLIDGDMLRIWTREWFRPERIVIAGAGMPHEELVELADKHFGHLTSPSLYSTITSNSTSQSRLIPPQFLQNSQSTPSVYKSLATAASSLLSPSTGPYLDASFEALASAKARYSGGSLQLPAQGLDFEHVYVAFEGVSIRDPDIYPMAVIQMLLGGGGSFSSGGPGKGMYTRLYTHVLNHYHTIDHCASFHHIYADTSLLGLFASFTPDESMRKVLSILAHQLSLLLYEKVPAVELARAKKQLQSSLAMSMESRAVEVEDLGRQILVHGRKVGAIEMAEKVDAVTAEDLQRVAHKLFGDNAKPPTVIGMGTQDIGQWPDVFKTYGVGPLQ